MKCGIRRRDLRRIPDIVGTLQQYWELMPDLRLWQIMSILEDQAKRMGKDPFNLEDDKWLEIIRQLYEEELESPTYIAFRDEQT